MKSERLKFDAIKVYKYGMCIRFGAGRGGKKQETFHQRAKSSLLRAIIINSNASKADGGEAAEESSPPSSRIFIHTFRVRDYGRQMKK